MVVAVLVVGLVGTLVVLGTRPSDAARLRTVAAGVAVFIEETRLAAARNGYGIALRYDPERRMLSAGPRRLEVPRDVLLETSDGAASLDVSIRPSGENDGALISLSRGRARIAVHFDWLTGAVQVRE